MTGGGREHFDSVYLLDLVLTNFQIITSPSAFGEISEFAIHDDNLGQAAHRILGKIQKIVVEKPVITERLVFVSPTDNDLFNLAFCKKIMLITDDIKLARHAESKIQTEFSTHFLPLFIVLGLLTKHEALQKLEEIRTVRNWQENTIYISAKEELNNLKD